MATDGLDIQDPAVALLLRNPDTGSYPTMEFEPFTRDGFRNIYPYPYILRLGLMLVLLCSRDPELEIAQAGKLDNTIKMKNFCYRELKYPQEMWPSLDVATKHKDAYRRIVSQCLDLPGTPMPMPHKGKLDTAGRRSFLKENVVCPLYRLLRDMKIPSDENYQKEQEPRSRRNKSPMQQSKQSNSEDINPESEDWIKRLQESDLQNDLSTAFQNKKMNRPKIALLDTGFDPEA